MSIDQSGGLRMEIGVLYLSHAMLVLTELIVCSMRRFACILAKLGLVYCDESLSYIWKCRGLHVISEPTHTLGGEVLA